MLMEIHNARLYQGYFPLGESPGSGIESLLELIHLQSFTLMSICWGGIDFGEGRGGAVRFIRLMLSLDTGYNMANQTPYLDSTLRWGLDWLMKVNTCVHLVCE